MVTKRGPYTSTRQQNRWHRVLRATAKPLEFHCKFALTMQVVATISDVSIYTLYNLFGHSFGQLRGSRDQLLFEVAFAHPRGRLIERNYSK